MPVKLNLCFFIGGADPLVRAGRPRPAGRCNEEAGQGVGRGRGRPPHRVFINFGGPQAHRGRYALTGLVEAFQLFSSQNKTWPSR